MPKYDAIAAMSLKQAQQGKKSTLKYAADAILFTPEAKSYY